MEAKFLQQSQSHDATFLHSYFVGVVILACLYAFAMLFASFEYARLVNSRRRSIAGFTLFNAMLGSLCKVIFLLSTPTTENENVLWFQTASNGRRLWQTILYSGPYMTMAMILTGITVFWIEMVNTTHGGLLGFLKRPRPFLSLCCFTFGLIFIPLTYAAMDNVTCFQIREVVVIFYCGFLLEINVIYGFKTLKHIRQLGNTENADKFYRFLLSLTIFGTVNLTFEAVTLFYIGDPNGTVGGFIYVAHKDLVKGLLFFLVTNQMRERYEDNCFSNLFRRDYEAPGSTGTKDFRSGVADVSVTL